MMNNKYNLLFILLSSVILMMLFSMAYFEIGPTNIAPVGRLFVQQISLKQIGRNDETGIESVILDLSLIHI